MQGGKIHPSTQCEKRGGVKQKEHGPAGGVRENNSNRRDPIFDKSKNGWSIRESIFGIKR